MRAEGNYLASRHGPLFPIWRSTRLRQVTGSRSFIALTVVRKVAWSRTARNP
jgi:hypothetical protein